jgi:hypothetical protein
MQLILKKMDTFDAQINIGIKGYIRHYQIDGGETALPKANRSCQHGFRSHAEMAVVNEVILGRNCFNAA